jgi:hypothetical protein
MSIETFDIDASHYLQTLNRAIDRKFLMVSVEASSALHILQSTQDRRINQMIKNVGIKYNKL